LRADAQRLTSAAKSIALPGLAIPAPWYVRALRGRPSEEQAFVHDVLGDADLLLTPALAGEVPDWDEVSPGHPRYHGKHLQALHENFPFANYLGLPALVFPIGQDSRGRPVSVQAVARRHDENLLLAFAHQAAQLAG
jgi:aspartyl-tRNA(Asn)/glutamyl-tRNA(Gln) amidotransferase subunit A